MRVEDLLKAKSHDVETIRPDATVVSALNRLTTMGIGALVVSTDGARVEGMITERDVVRAATKHGSRMFEMQVSDVMTRGGPSCAPGDGIRHVMAVMTRSRCRHIPVVLSGGQLCGLVSIGDVVKHRLEELELETTVLRDRYLVGR
jgi:CBS domain-containing protein